MWRRSLISGDGLLGPALLVDAGADVFAAGAITLRQSALEIQCELSVCHLFDSPTILLFPLEPVPK